MMVAAAKLVSALVTIALMVATVSVNPDTPRTPAELARRTTDARSNLERAVAHTDASVERTQAFETIARNVRSQLRSSRLLLEIQLDLEASSKKAGRASRRVRARLGRLRDVYARVASRLRGLSELSRKAGNLSADSATAGEALLTRLDTLKNTFQKVVTQSKRLNRKARAFQEVGEGP